jgi:hypothetical protein
VTRTSNFQIQKIQDAAHNMIFCHFSFRRPAFDDVGSNPKKVLQPSKVEGSAKPMLSKNEGPED